MSDFHGAKLAILSGDRIVTILRDDLPSIPWPGHWDLPGGGREGAENPEDCVLRELEEEMGLRLDADALHWRLESLSAEGHRVWFFVSEQPRFDPGLVRFGAEGSEWRLAPITWFLGEALTVPHHRHRLERYLFERADHADVSRA